MLTICCQRACTQAQMLRCQGNGRLLFAQDANQTANTALLFHGGRLLALQEQDMPYRVRALRDRLTPQCDGMSGSCRRGARHSVLETSASRDLSLPATLRTARTHVGLGG